MNLKLNNEINQQNSYKIEPDNNFVFYNQNNQNFKQIPQNINVNYNNPNPSQNLQGNFSNSPNINYFNNFQQQQTQPKPQKNNNNIIFQKPVNQLDFQGSDDFQPNMNKMNFPNQNVSQYSNVNPNAAVAIATRINLRRGI